MRSQEVNTIDPLEKKDKHFLCIDFPKGCHGLRSFIPQKWLRYSLPSGVCIERLWISYNISAIHLLI